MTEQDLPLAPRDEDDALAAEYVQGVLPLADRIAAERRAAGDAEFAARITARQNRLADLNGTFSDPPAPDLMPAIEARLFGKPAPRRLPMVWMTGVLTIAALVVAVVAVLPLICPAPVVATLGAPDAPLRFEARHDGTTLTITRISGSPAPQGQMHEVWIIAPDAAPVSLGLIGDAPLTVAYPDTPQGWTIAVSLEPEGGSPAGAPTGPVLAAGTINDI